MKTPLQYLLDQPGLMPGFTHEEYAAQLKQLQATHGAQALNYLAGYVQNLKNYPSKDDPEFENARHFHVAHDLAFAFDSKTALRTSSFAMPFNPLK
jgi:hypothetical protein